MIEIEQKTRGRPPWYSMSSYQTRPAAPQHRVTLSNSTYERLTGGKVDPKSCIESAFKFLLERESKADILPSFDINVINMSFPSFEKEFGNYI